MDIDSVDTDSPPRQEIKGWRSDFGRLALVATGDATADLLFTRESGPPEPFGHVTFDEARAMFEVYWNDFGRMQFGRDTIQRLDWRIHCAMVEWVR
jgi:hypothetical protein